ncbi:MarR family transcriptional regulator [Clostridium perfringens]
MNKEEQVISDFRDLFNKLAWLNKSKMEKCLKGYKPSEIHCIEYIANNVDCNVTKLAESFYMTRGAISKLSKKLMEKGLIESYQKEDNKKEIYFKLTEKGKAINKIHDDLHNEFQERDKAVFDKITEEQFDYMINFAKKYSDHLDEEIKKIGLNTKSE